VLEPALFQRAGIEPEEGPRLFDHALNLCR
jgi:hypothetical protein